MAVIKFLKQNCNFDGYTIIYNYRYKSLSIEELISKGYTYLVSPNSKNVDSFEIKDDTTESTQYCFTTTDKSYNVVLSGTTEKLSVATSTTRSTSDNFTNGYGIVIHQYRANILDGATSSRRLSTTSNTSYMILNYDNSISETLPDTDIKNAINNNTIETYMETNGNNYTPTIVMPTSIKITTPSSTIIKKNETITLNSVVLPDNTTDKTVTYTASNSNVSVNGNIITGVNDGDVIITATTVNGLSDTLTLTVSGEIEPITHIKAMTVQNYAKADLIVTGALLDEYTQSDIIYKNETGTIQIDFDLLKSTAVKSDVIRFATLPKDIGTALSSVPYLNIVYTESEIRKSINVSGKLATVHPINSTSTADGYYIGLRFENSDDVITLWGGDNSQYDTPINVDDIVSMTYNCNAGSPTPPTPTPTEPSEYGLFNIYKTTVDELNNLSSDRFKVTSTEYYYTTEDLYKYITSLIEYPFDIKATETMAVILGDNVTQVNSHIVDDTNVKISFDMKVNGYYKDTRDINNSVLTCYLPFIEQFDIEARYINTTIKVVYNVDLLTNACVCYLYSDDNLITTKSVIMGYKMPFIQKDEKINELTDNNRFIKNQCFIKVVQNLNESSRFTTLKKDTLKNFSGFIRTNEHIEIKASIPKNELDEIKTLLQSGIII